MRTKVEIPLWMIMSLQTTWKTIGQKKILEIDDMQEALRTGNYFFIPHYNKEIHKAFWPLVQAVHKKQTIVKVPSFEDSEIFYIEDENHE